MANRLAPSGSKKANKKHTQPLYDQSYELSASQDDERYQSSSSEQNKGVNDVLKRSFSSPNTTKLHQNPNLDDGPSDNTSEKKRNKLGYHRTSIACSHCRRRKIRCIASADVPNRCVNCIRLKKECSFYPVDQQPGPESRPKGSTRQSRPSASPSPAIRTGSPAEALSQNSGTSTGGLSTPNLQVSQNDYFSTDTSAPPSGLSSNNAYPYPSQPPPTAWMPSEVNPVGISKPDEVNMPWHAYPMETSLGGQFSPYGQPSNASVVWTSGTSEAGSHDDMAWGEFPPTMRSMSYSGESTGQSHNQGAFVQAAQGQIYERRPSDFSDVYPPFTSAVPDVGMNAMAAMGTQGHVIPGPHYAPGMENWRQQPVLASQGHGAWPHASIEGNQQILMDERRSTPNASQAGSGIYFST